jgi:hypothetical protein
MSTPEPQPDAGFVKRGFYLLAGMGVLAAIVLAILFGRPATTQAPVDSDEVKSLAPSSDGWEIRYAATISLTRIDSNRIPWQNYEEMLNENQQLRNHRVKLNDGSIVANEAAARSIVLRALVTLREWHERHSGETPPDEVVKLYPLVEKLAQSPIAPVRVEALKTQETLKAYAKS